MLTLHPVNDPDDIKEDEFPEFVSIMVQMHKLSKIIHADNRKWWVDLNTGIVKDRNVAEMLMLIVSEVAEAMEGDRKGLMDDKLPHRKMLEVELADAIIRALDLGAGMGQECADVVDDRLDLVDDVHHRDAQVGDFFAHRLSRFAHHDEDGQQCDGLQQHG